MKPFRDSEILGDFSALNFQRSFFSTVTHQHPSTRQCAHVPGSIPDVRVLNPVTVEGEGFEPSKAEPADLQSAPVGHLGTPPTKPHILAISVPKCQIGSFSSLISRRATAG